MFILRSSTWSQMRAVVRDAGGHSRRVATIRSPSAQHKLQSTTLRQSCQRPERVTGWGCFSLLWRCAQLSSCGRALKAKQNLSSGEQWAAGEGGTRGALPRVMPPAPSRAQHGARRDRRSPAAVAVSSSISTQPFHNFFHKLSS